MTHPQAVVEAVELALRQIHSLGLEGVPVAELATRAIAIALLNQITPELVAGEREAMEWKDMPPPNDADILVLRSTGALQYIEADDNDYTWFPSSHYADAGPAVDCPVAWMPAAAAIRARGMK